MAYRRRARATRRRPTRRATVSRTPYRRRTKRVMGRKKQVIPQGKPCVCPSPLTPAHKFILAQLDPFTTSVQGAKIPDSNSIPSIAHVDTDLVGMTHSSTFSASAFRPNYTAAWIQATAGTTEVAWPTDAQLATLARDRSKRPQYIQQIELTRPVAHAVRLTSSIAPTTATGFVHIGIATESTQAFNDGTNNRIDYPRTVAQMANLQYYKRVTLASLTQSPITVINKWMDETAFRYSASASRFNIGDTNAVGVNPREFQTDFSWGTIVVMLEGAPNGVSLSAEHLLMSEGIPSKDGVIIGSPAAPNNPGAMSAANAVTTTVDATHTEAEQDGYFQQGVNAAMEGAQAAGRDAFNNVAVPLAQQIGYNFAGRALNMGMMAIAGVGGLAGVNNNPNRLALN